MRAKYDVADLMKVLSICRELVARSEDSDWSCMGVQEILAALDAAIGRLHKSQSVDLQELRFLFVVTGPLQETSMSNGWANEVLTLAALFDRIIGEPLR